MSEVKVTVGDRKYTIACGDGQEERIEFLAGLVDDKLTAMGGNLTSNEAKNLLFASLMLADEVDDARSRPDPSTETAAPAQPQIDDSAIAARLERLATAFENAASALEGGPTTS